MYIFCWHGKDYIEEDDDIKDYIGVGEMVGKQVVVVLFVTIWLIYTVLKCTH